MFVIDTSGSMNGLRLQTAKRELTTAVNALPSDAELGILVFNTQVTVWRPALIPATPAAKQEATYFIRNLAAGGRTAAYDALDRAFHFDPEAIYFLSDGEPTCGRIVALDGILAAVRAGNRNRRISIYSIGIAPGAPGSLLELFMKTLAEQNFGRFQRVDQSKGSSMKLVTYESDHGPRVAGLRDGQIIDLQRADRALPSCPKALLAQGPEAIRRAEKAVAAGPALDRSVALIAPIPNPEKVICIGLNYADHARESGAVPPSEPVLFNKFPTAVSAHQRPIVLPRASQEVDYEAELVVVIGRGGRHIPRSRAREHIAAYCCGNDVSARDWQLRKPGGQWLAGKSFDSFAPCGPWLVTADEISDPRNLRIQLATERSADARFQHGPVDLLRRGAGQLCLRRLHAQPGRSDLHRNAAGGRLRPQAARIPSVRRRRRSGDQRIGTLRNPVVAENNA